MAKINFLSGGGKINEDGKNDSDNSQFLIEQHLKKQDLFKKCEDFLEGNNVKETVKEDVKDLIEKEKDFLIGNEGIIIKKTGDKKDIVKIEVLDFNQEYYGILLRNYENTQVYEEVKKYKNYHEIDIKLQKKIREKDYNILLVQHRQKMQAEMFNPNNISEKDKKMLGMF